MNDKRHSIPTWSPPYSECFFQFLFFVLFLSELKVSSGVVIRFTEDVKSCPVELRLVVLDDLKLLFESLTERAAKASGPLKAVLGIAPAVRNSVMLAIFFFIRVPEPEHWTELVVSLALREAVGVRGGSDTALRFPYAVTG